MSTLKRFSRVHQLGEMRRGLQLAEYVLGLGSTSACSRVCSKSWSRAAFSGRVHATGPIIDQGLPQVEDFVSLSSPASNTANPRYRAHNGGFPIRTAYCDALSESEHGQRVILSGWLQTARKLGSMSFIILRDYTGTIQLVYRSADLDMPHELDLAELPPESIISIEGTVQARPSKARKEGARGQVELIVRKFTLLNPAERPLAFYPTQTDNLPSAEFRNKYRYLELRREDLANNIRKRSRVTRVIRNVLDHQGFLDVETPVLLNSTPEGAREFLVPTRLHPLNQQGEAVPHESGDPPSPPTFYALAQSPQQAKQLLICSGAIEKYYQFARCFRDEDGRKDRQPEFTQLDMEMGFVSWAPREHDLVSGWRIGGVEVKDAIEMIIRRIWEEMEGVRLPETFRTITYQEAMTKYGSDKPDTRIPLEIVDLTTLMPMEYQEEIRTAKTEQCRAVDCLRIPRESPFATRDLRFLGKKPNSEIQRITISEDNLMSWLPDHPQVRFGNNTDLMRDLNNSLSLEVGDHLFLWWRDDYHSGGSTPLGSLRLALAEQAEKLGKYTPPKEPHFLWVTEFPLFTKDVEKADLVGGEWSSSHHPFTAPMPEDIDVLMMGESRHLKKVRGQHYDLVLNGMEIGGGSVRIHDAVLQEFIMEEILKLNKPTMARFNHLLQSLRSGAPPHAGIALGFDRLMSILCNTPSIREVIAFPKTAEGRDPLFGSPSPAREGVLGMYGIRAGKGRRQKHRDKLAHDVWAGEETAGLQSVEQSSLTLMREQWKLSEDWGKDKRENNDN